VYAEASADAAVDGDRFEEGVSIMVVSSKIVLLDAAPVELAIAVVELRSGGGDVIGLITSDEGGGRTGEEARVLCHEVAVAKEEVELIALGADTDGLKTELKEFCVEVSALGLKDEEKALGIADDVLDRDVNVVELTAEVVRLESKEGV